jgi:protein-L-isoaspartate(D-aspartate) O-methyltransferase
MEDGSDAPVLDRSETGMSLPDTALANFLVRLRASGIRRAALISAFEDTQRRFFLAPALRQHAYASFALPIDCGEEATAPGDIARMISVAEASGTDRVLEIGTGSGFQTVLLARICRSVVSVERWRSLSDRAAVQLQREAVRNAELRHADGLALPPGEKFDLVIVNGALPSWPSGLIETLRPGGRIVAAIRNGSQSLLTRLDVGASEPMTSAHGTLDLAPLRAGISKAL